MGNFTFDNSIPAAQNDPSADQPNMLQNNISTALILDVDHVGFDLNNGGTHRAVTFPGTALTPTPLPLASFEISPESFGTITPYIETYIENTYSNGSTVVPGYLPYVKCIGSYVGVAGPYGAGIVLTPVLNSLNRNIATVTQTSANIITVVFTVPLIYDTYSIILDAETGLNVTAVTSRTPVQFTVGGGNWTGRRFQFMVI